MKNEELTKRAVEARRQYHRLWKRRNPDANKKAERNFWERYADKLEQERNGKQSKENIE